MTEKTSPSCARSRALSLPVRLALCVGIGTSLAVSNDWVTGIAVGAGLFFALRPAGKRD